MQPYIGGHKDKRNLKDYIPLIAFSCLILSIIYISRENENILLILLIIIIASVYLIIIHIIDNIKFNKELRRKGGLKKMVDNLLGPLSYYYSLKPSYEKGVIKANPFEAYIKNKHLFFVWNKEIMWEFNILDDHCDSNFLYYKALEIYDKIVLNQSLSQIQKLSHPFRLEYVKNRIFSYDYEDFLYEIFSHKTQYSEKRGFSCFFYPVDFNSFLISIENEYKVFGDDSLNLIKTLENHQLIYVKDNKVNLGQTLSMFWNIISEEDNNFNKWCWKHNIKPKFISV